MKRDSGFPLSTHLQAGYLGGDLCYGERNTRSFLCGINGWPQHDPQKPMCAGNNNERRLIECLYESKAPNWWNAFPGCTDAAQCYNQRPAETKP